jgi:hypothetical protein
MALFNGTISCASLNTTLNSALWEAGIVFGDASAVCEFLHCDNNTSPNDIFGCAMVGLTISSSNFVRNFLSGSTNAFFELRLSQPSTIQDSVIRSNDVSSNKFFSISSYGSAINVLSCDLQEAASTALAVVDSSTAKTLFPFPGQFGGTCERRVFPPLCSDRLNFTAFHHLGMFILFLSSFLVDGGGFSLDPSFL